MIKIGDFSNLAHISIKTLHHYDQMGLLKPAHIDRFSGYRYYTLQQLALLNRILALKDLGLSLEQVSQLLHDDISPAEMRGMLRLKRLELSARVDEEQARLARVEQRLRQLEQEQNAVSVEIALKQVPAQVIISAQIIAANESMILPARQSLCDLIQDHLDRAQLRPVSPWFALVNTLPYSETDQEITLAVAVNLRAAQRAGDWTGAPVRLQELSAVPSMSSVIHGDHDRSLLQTYTSLYAWTQANGYHIVGPFREIYLPETGLNASSSPLITASLIELQCPVERSGIPLSLKSEKEKPMQPQIVNKPAFQAVGLPYIGKNQHNEISQLWNQFIPRISEPKAVDPGVSYGLCFMEPAGAREGEFEYIACMEVANDSDIPAGMVYRQVPGYKYAVFTHQGSLEKLGETYQYIFNTWLPQSGLQVHPSKFDMEVYDVDYDPEVETAKFYIYVAIQ